MTAVDTTCEEIVNELRSLGSESIKRIFLRHGAPEPIFGVKIEYLQKIRRRIGVDYKLALELYDTGISDAMYLAGLIADDAKMSKKDLQKWANGASWHMVSEYTVPWVASGSKHGRALALKWIDSKKERLAEAGWATLSAIAATTPDEDLNIPEYKKLLERVVKTIHDRPNYVKYVMNNFVIAVGSYIAELTTTAEKAAKAIGKVHVDMGDTSCNVPNAYDYIQKVKGTSRIGVKRKTAKC